MVRLPVLLDRLDIAGQVLGVLGHGCRVVKVLHQHSEQGGPLRAVFGVVVVGGGRQPCEAEKVFGVLQFVPVCMD